MVIQRTILGLKRVELQNKPIILATSAVNVLTPGDRQKITNPALNFSVLVWNGDVLEKITPSAAYQGAFAQYQTRVKQELNIDVSNRAILGLTNEVVVPLVPRTIVSRAKLLTRSTINSSMEALNWQKKKQYKSGSSPTPKPNFSKNKRYITLKNWFLSKITKLGRKMISWFRSKKD